MVLYHNNRKQTMLVLKNLLNKILSLSYLYRRYLILPRFGSNLDKEIRCKQKISNKSDYENIKNDKRELLLLVKEGSRGKEEEERERREFFLNSVIKNGFRKKREKLGRLGWTRRS